MKRSYTAEFRAEAVGLAQSMGVTRAARHLGIPHRTVSEWSRRPEMQSLIVRSQEDVAAKLWEAVCVGTEEVLRRMRDPKARLADVARALEVVSERHLLLTGRATQHIATAARRANFADDGLPLGLNETEARDMLALIGQQLALRDRATEPGGGEVQDG